MTWRSGLAALVVTGLIAAAIVNANGYELFVLSLVGLTAIVGIGLNVLLGLSGQISLGHVGFYAIGAYTVGILTAHQGWSFWLALPAAGVIAGIAGAALAIPALRVRGPYLAMVTIAFGFVVEQGAAEWKGLTGGWNGLMGIPTPAVAGTAFDEVHIAFLVLGLTLVCLWLYSLLGRSPWGKAMRAVRDSEVAGQSIGLNPVAVRTMAFAVSAVAAGVAGGVFASMSSFISPESFPFFQSILFLLVVLIGGADRVLGPVVGAVVVVLLPEFLSALAEYRLLFVGALLLLVLRLAPGGIVGVAGRLLTRSVAETPQRREGDVGPFLSSGAAAAPLRVRDLSIAFGGVQAVDDLEFEAQPGHVTSIIGPNGAGKTTVLNVIGGFYAPGQGAVELGDLSVAGLSSHSAARKGIGRTYQTTQLFEQMTVLDNILIALRRGALGLGKLFRPDDRAADIELAESLLAFVGYDGPSNRPAGDLPHVDKRLVEVARALATRPQVLLLDEPAAGLGEADTERIGELLGRIAEFGTTVILVEHDMSLVMSASDHVVVMDAGRKIAGGAPAEVRSNPVVLKAYLGEEQGRGRPRAEPRQAGEEVLAVADLGASYGAAPVLDGIDLGVERGELVAVLGANGAGKSTLMRSLSGLHRPITGTVQLSGIEIQERAAHRIARAGAVLVPEGRQVFPDLSVTDNIRLGAYARAGADLEQEVAQMFERFPRLAERRHQPAGLLSGGEQQMLAIARGLVARPTLLMLDEPSLGLAPTLIQRLYGTLADLRDEGMTVLLVDQVAAMALGVCDRAFVLESGRISPKEAASGDGDQAVLERAYLGDS